MNTLIKFDTWFIRFAKRHYTWLARISLAIIFFYFGALKLAGFSPADELAIGFAEKMGVGMYAEGLYLAVAVVECIIGLLILFPAMTRIALFIMIIHMIIVSAPLVLYPEVTWAMWFVPSLEGQYIIKNSALVALALGLVAATRPLQKRARN